MQLLLIFSFFLTVHALAIEQRSCVSSDVIAVAQQVTRPHYFCAWYLSDGRTKSPLQNIKTNALLTACKCITSAEPAGANAKNLDAIAKAARLQSFVSATCSSASGSPISKEFKDPFSFCSFFNSFERYDSPIPNLNVPAVRHACNGLDLDQEIKLQVIFIFGETGCENLVDPVYQIKQQAGCQDFLEQDFHYQVILYSRSTSSSVLSTPTLDAYDIITSGGLKAFCTTYLDYTIPTATMTVTVFAAITEMNNFTLSTTLTTTSVSIETNFVGTVTVTADYIVDKRSVATPTALAAYPEDAISSGCSRAAKLPATQTIAETITLTSIKTIATTAISIAYETEASVATISATSTATALSPVYTGAPCTHLEPYGAVWEGSSGRYELYCTGQALYGTRATSVQVLNMGDCLDQCAAYNCTGVYLGGNDCSLCTGDVGIIDGASGYRAAIRVQ
ncbi:hypothetical protein KCU64_g6630, partial [Aureobasidium melanogenum]